MSCLIVSQQYIQLCFFKSGGGGGGGDTLSDHDLHHPLKCATFRNPLRPTPMERGLA